MVKAKCLYCNQDYIKSVDWQKFCSRNCYRKNAIKVALLRYYTHKEEKIAKMTTWQKKNKEKFSLIKRRWRSKPENKEKRNLYQRTRLKHLRLKALYHYGGDPPTCACCKETIMEFLTLDHIDKQGTQHRKAIRESIWSWLKRNNYPNYFRILCYNCNCSRGAYNYCPHQKLTD